MILSGLALAFSRLIDNSVIVLENIFRHIELGEEPAIASEKGANEVGLAVLAITIVTVVVFFPVTLLYGVSKFLFTALALSVVISLFASYFVAVSVVPLYCANLLKGVMHHDAAAEEANEPGVSASHRSLGREIPRAVQLQDSTASSATTTAGSRRPSIAPRKSSSDSSASSLLSLALYPLVGLSFFPRTDAGQFIINVKAPTGTRIEVTEDYVKKVEDIVRQVVRPGDLSTIVSNIGLTPDLSSLSTPNSAMHTAFVEVGLKEDHKIGSYVYMDEVRKRVAARIARTAHVFPVRRLGRFRSQPGHACPHRRAGKRKRFARRRRHRPASGG